ncbi:MAG: hypothetical protein ACLRTQ_07720 [Candidatus Borkfalkia sp.]
MKLDDEYFRNLFDNLDEIDNTPMLKELLAETDRTEDILLKELSPKGAEFYKEYFEAREELFLEECYQYFKKVFYFAAICS